MLKTAVLALVFHLAFSIQHSGLTRERLRSVGALPPHQGGVFDEITACHLTPDGEYLVFDRRAHSVFIVPRTGEPRKVISIGIEAGQILRPLAFDSAPDGTFVIADAPTGVERIQVFFYLGGTVGGFTLPGRSIP